MPSAPDLVINHVFSRIIQSWSLLNCTPPIHSELAMRKEPASAMHLADMIVCKIGVVGLEILVRRDHAFGWQPTVVAAPNDLIGFQRRAEEIAHRLRSQFDLRE